MYTVYGLHQKGILVYIGLTINIKQRIADHSYSGKVFDSYDVIKNELTLEDAVELECSLIRQHQPKYNGNNGGGIGRPIKYADGPIVLNFKVRKSFRNKFKQRALDDDKSMTDILHEAFALYEKQNS